MKYMISGTWQHTIEAKSVEEAEDKMAQMLSDIDSWDIDDVSDA